MVYKATSGQENLPDAKWRNIEINFHWSDLMVETRMIFSDVASTVEINIIMSMSNVKFKISEGLIVTYAIYKSVERICLSRENNRLS